MFLRSLQWRLVSFFCVIAICLIIPIGLFLNKSVEDFYYNGFKEAINDAIKGWNPDGEIMDTTSMYKSLERYDPSVLYGRLVSKNKSLTIVDIRNNDFYTSDERYEGKNSQFFNEISGSENFIRAMNGIPGGERTLVKHGSREFFDYASPVAENFVLYFRYYKDEWQPTIDAFNKIVLTGLVMALIIAFILGYMLSKTITVPIVRIMHKAESISAGDFEQVLEVKSDDEIGNLTKAFNYMARSLKDTLVEISSEKNKIETILNYMTDGVVAFNLKGEVIHANPASKKILSKKEINQSFNCYANEYGLDIRIEDILYLETLNSREELINVEGKTVSVYFAVFSDEKKNPEGIIAVLQDVTRQQKLEDMRKEFVANVSHELRTPLTSIKSYTETLLDGVLDDRETSEKFLKVINSEADRMTRLVKDLLQLSRLDNNGQMYWKMDSVCFSDLVRGAVEKMSIEAKNKEQQLECYAIGEIPFIRADYDRIEQIVLNIISNAIKYTPGGGKITVYIGKIVNDVYVKVADTGIGIPESDLSRVFERFYRVDKARSREMGGTGLGLAIAKEIAEAHSGSVSIKSEYGKGTEVTVRLPAEQQV